MPKMTKPELKQINEKRLPILGMGIGEKIEAKIVDLSQGFPGYANLLYQNARKQMIVNDGDLQKAIERPVELAEETVKEAYLKAVRSTKPSHKYKEAI
jgi:hypothetical protein